MTDIRIINHASLNGVWMDWLLQPNGLLDESMELATGRAGCSGHRSPCYCY